MTTKIPAKFNLDEVAIIDTPVSVPVMTAREAITCAATLTSVEPAPDRPLVTKAHGQIIVVADALKVKLEEPVEKTGLIRAAASRHDATVNAVFTVVEGHARMPFPESPHTQAAVRVTAAVFPDGLAWLRASGAEKWGSSSAKLHLIDESPELIEDLNFLVGEFAMANWRQSHGELGAAIGIGAAVDLDDDLRDVDVLKLSRALRERIGDYVRVVRGFVDRDDPATIAEATRLLTPLVHFREMIAASRGGRDEPEAPIAVNSSPPAPADTIIDAPAVAAPMAADVPDPA
jgi:hypothetical protein